MENKPKQLFIDKSWGLFMGQFKDNALHKHYAIQIGLASKAPFTVTDGNEKAQQFDSCLIGSNVKHQFSSDEISLIILVNPISAVGHQLRNEIGGKNFIPFDTEIGLRLQGFFSDFNRGEVEFERFVGKVGKAFGDYKCHCESENHFADDRVYKAIQYLEKNFDRVVSLNEIAGYCFLSESRFLHLFKQKTDLNFRRYQLWNKLLKSLSHLKKHSITDTAHTFGFTDSAHYSRTFKETFGLNPKFFLKIK